jgi:hypothetical protein
MLQHIEEALRPLHPPGTTFEPKLAKNDGVIVASTGSLETNHREYLYRVVPLPATQLEGEAESLKRINEASPDAAPRFVATGTLQDQQQEWMICEWHGESPLFSATNRSIY